ncbi:hypothetical protein DFH11DRAFT_407245 [Phellopilus nigrolimitatus]|nr:hypothetical protein DFH11DRAFT_407245 [Phellopilus nigrolimitatus]
MCSLHLFALFSFFSPISCALVNVTIDDTNGDSITGTHITYNPFDAWQKGQDCTNCTALLNSDKLYDGTWHDASYNPVRGTSNSYPGTIISASVSFTGSAVYVICTLTGSTSSPDGNTDMTFIVDGSTAGTFERSPNGDTSYSFGQIVFAKSGLDQRKHTLSIESGIMARRHSCCWTELFIPPIRC